MQPEEAKNKLWDFLTGTLSEVEEKALKECLKNSDETREYFEEMQSTHEDWRHMPLTAPSPKLKTGFYAMLEQQIEEEQAEKSAPVTLTSTQGGGGFLSGNKVGLRRAAALLLFAVLSWTIYQSWQLMNQGNETTASEYREEKSVKNLEEETPSLVQTSPEEEAPPNDDEKTEKTVDKPRKPEEKSDRLSKNQVKQPGKEGEKPFIREDVSERPIPKEQPEPQKEGVPKVALKEEKEEVSDFINTENGGGVQQNRAANMGKPGVDAKKPKAKKAGQDQYDDIGESKKRAISKEKDFNNESNKIVNEMTAAPMNSSSDLPEALSRQLCEGEMVERKKVLSFLEGIASDIRVRKGVVDAFDCQYEEEMLGLLLDFVLKFEIKEAKKSVLKLSEDRQKSEGLRQKAREIHKSL